MRRVTRSVLVPFPAMAMFELVDRVEDYPRFLPWCSGVSVLDTHEDGRTVRVDIDYHGVKAHFTTRNVNVPGEAIVVALKDGPFRSLHGQWKFRTLAPEACRVELELAYEFTTHVLEQLVGPVFGHVANTFIDSFVRRAESIYARKR
jgi:ribosome-associated toxin RatA of RatAB toxin-antitoxin module